MDHHQHVPSACRSRHRRGLVGAVSTLWCLAGILIAVAVVGSNALFCWLAILPASAALMIIFESVLGASRRPATVPACVPQARGLSRRSRCPWIRAELDDLASVSAIGGCGWCGSPGAHLTDEGCPVAPRHWHAAEIEERLRMRLRAGDATAIGFPTDAAAAGSSFSGHPPTIDDRGAEKGKRG